MAYEEAVLPLDKWYQFQLTIQRIEKMLYQHIATEDLEKQWKAWVLKLDPKDPYGGTRKKKPASKRN